jgi:hypothetical protein
VWDSIGCASVHEMCHWEALALLVSVHLVFENISVSNISCHVSVVIANYPCLLKNVFTYTLFNDAVSSLDYMATDVRMVKEWIREDVEGSGRGLIWDISRAFEWRNWRKLAFRPSLDPKTSRTQLGNFAGWRNLLDFHKYYLSNGPIYIYIRVFLCNNTAWKGLRYTCFAWIPHYEDV